MHALFEHPYTSSGRDAGCERDSAKNLSYVTICMHMPKSFTVDDTMAYSTCNTVLENLGLHALTTVKKFEFQICMQKIERYSNG